jgi:uncharacterized alkaline shock family protein YloU
MNDNETPRGDENGVIHISDEVVASIAALTAADVEGVAALSAGVDIGEWLGRKNLSKGVKLTTQDSTVLLDISLLVRYGYAIPAVSRLVQKKVKDAVESMTGLTVGEINVHVVGVSFDKEDKPKEAKPKKEKQG